jgi:ABC-type nitrate/sulfonate/bicarbonate transport system permease component
MMASLVIIIGFILLIFSGLKVVEERLTPWRAPAT